VTYIAAKGNAFAFYSYAKNRMLLDNVRVLIGHMYDGDIYGEYDNNIGTRLLRPDLNLVLDGRCLGLRLFVSIFNVLFSFILCSISNTQKVTLYTIMYSRYERVPSVEKRIKH